MGELTYRTVRSARKTVSIEIKDGGIVVRAPYIATDGDIARIVAAHRERIEKMLEADKKARAAVKLTDGELRELAQRAAEHIPERCRYYAEKLGVTYGPVTIRAQRTKWGSCSSKGSLSFNCLLMLTPPGTIDSVVVHELCHRLEMNHSAAFYEKVLSVFPDYREHDAYLKKHGRELLARLP